MEVIRDIVCQVYAGQKSKRTIDLVLNTFIPDYEKLHLDLTNPVGNPDYLFKSEDEMVNYFIENEGLSQVFYWNKYHNNPDKLMVGAIITADDKLIMSLTLDGNVETRNNYYKKLKELLNSNIAVITYVNPAEYESGNDFVLKYSQNTGT